MTQESTEPRDDNRPATAAASGAGIRGGRAAKLRLFDRRLRWGPTPFGWLVFLLTMALAAYSLRWAQPFLAICAPVQAEILVVEGWIPDNTVQRCVSELRPAEYQRVISVGGPVFGVGPSAKDDDTHAYVGATRLRKYGVPADRVDFVPSTSVTRDRTLQSALDLRRWLDRHGLAPRAINVATMGSHARRTRLLFQAAMGPGVRVGAIGLRNDEYDPDLWWCYSEGVKEVIAEAAGYLYARIRFFP